MNSNASDFTSMSKKLRWFERGATALARYFPDFPAGVYGCPLCQHLFNVDALDDHRLTLEHVPPRSMGGNEMLLICRECNNWAGSSLVHHAATQRSISGFLRGDMRRSESVRLSIGEHWANAEVTASADLIQASILPSPQNNPPGAPDDFHDVFISNSSSSESFEFDLKVVFLRRFNEQRVPVSWLCSAFFVGFSVFGYVYTGCAEMEIVRRQIRSPDEQVIPYFWSIDPEAPTELKRIVLVNSSQKLNCLIVQFGTMIIFLPDPDPNRTPGFYERLHDDAKSHRKFVGTGSVIQWPTEPMHILDFHYKLAQNPEQ